MDLIGGGCVAPDRIGHAIAGREYAEWVSFEPGGQVELSLPAAADAAAAAAQLERVTSALAADLMVRGIVLDATPVRDRDLAVPRFLHSPRYVAMERHFDTVGPAGRRMMRATASTQICLDWWPGPAGIEQWRVLLLAAPFLAAATARSDRYPGPARHVAGGRPVPDRLRRPAAARKGPGRRLRRLRGRRDGLRRRASRRTSHDAVPAGAAARSLPGGPLPGRAPCRGRRTAGHGPGPTCCMTMSCVGPP